MAHKFIRNIKLTIEERKGSRSLAIQVKFRMLFKQNEFLVKESIGQSKDRKKFLEKYGMEVKKGTDLTEIDFSVALEDIFRRTSKEIRSFLKPKQIEKIGVEDGGILYSKNRILDGYEVRVLGELNNQVDLGKYSSVNFKVPLVDVYSPMATPMAYHLHTALNHMGADSSYRLSLEHIHIPGGRHIFKRIGQECVLCQKKRGRYVEQLMGPLHSTQLTVTPVFYFTLMDTWGPVTVYAPGYEKVTRNSKPYQAHMMVMACNATGTINCQMVEGLDAGSILEGLNRFFVEACVPVKMYPDAAGAIMKALTRGELDVEDLSGRLMRVKGVQFSVCPPQGHSAHGRIERKIGLIQKSLESSGMMACRSTFGGWQTICKLVEREINQIPLGYLSVKSSEKLNPLLRLLSPASMRLQTRTDRAPRSSFIIPDHPKDIMTQIDEIYQLWFRVWSKDYVPVIMGRDKWQREEKNLQPNDVVWFKLKESEMHSVWKLGKVESVEEGADGLVREAKVAYKNVDGKQEIKDEINWRHMTVVRPIRNLVKLFAVEDTTLMQDLERVRSLCEEVFEKEGGLAGGQVDEDRMMREEQGGEDTAAVVWDLEEKWNDELSYHDAYHYLHVLSENVKEEQVFLL